MEIVYCSKWWLKKKCPIDILSDEEAKERHNRGELYSAIISQNGQINYVIDVAPKHILVRFMDEDISPYLVYEFHKLDKNNIFLKAAFYYKYDDNQKEIESMIFNFSDTGNVVMEKRDCIKNEIEERKITCDVSCNWSKYPIFGEYDDLLHEER